MSDDPEPVSFRNGAAVPSAAHASPDGRLVDNAAGSHTGVPDLSENDGRPGPVAHLLGRSVHLSADLLIRTETYQVCILCTAWQRVPGFPARSANQ